MFSAHRRKKTFRQTLLLQNHHFKQILESQLVEAKKQLIVEHTNYVARNIVEVPAVHSH
jgi:hypothetical protein